MLPREATMRNRQLRRCGVAGLVLAALAGVAVAQGAGDAAIVTVAGAGRKGYSGDGGKATAARLNQPFHCDLDGKGHLFIADALNHCVRKVNLETGVISTVAGTGKKGSGGDGGPATQAT